MGKVPARRGVDTDRRKPRGRPESGAVIEGVELFRGNSEMAGRMRSLDWAETSLGPVSLWPQSLRSAIGILLASKTQINLFWGPQLVALYNDAYIDVLGSKHPWALGKPACEAWAEIWNETLGPLLAGVIRSGEAFQAQDHPFFLERQGFLEETYFDVSYDPVRVEGGDVGGIFCIVSERTERVLERRRLRTLRELSTPSLTGARSVGEACRVAAATIADNSFDAPFALIYHIDADGKTARLEGAAGMEPGTHSSPMEVCLAEGGSVLPLYEVASTNRPALVAANDLLALPASPWGEPPRCVMVLPVAARGREEPAALLVAGINPRRPVDELYQNFFSTIAGHISTAIANAQAYEAEKKRTEALAELDRARTAFFSNVSHEFRTPLTLLLGPLEDLLSSSTLPYDSRAQLEVVYRNSLRLLKLVNTLLDFSRIEAGRGEAAFEPLDISVVTAEIASNFRSAIEKAGMQLRVSCPPLAQPVYVDRAMFEKVVLNLLSNAFKFTFHGWIEVAVQSSHDGVELVVSDSGVGIPDQELPRIFDRFYRVKGAHGRTYEGTGIGLALVQELVKLHGGAIRAASVAGKGSTFTVSIPFGDAHLPAERVKHRRADAVTASVTPYVDEALQWLPDALSTVSSSNADRIDALGVQGSNLHERSRPRILLADDNADLCNYVARILRTRYEVHVVADGLAAIEALTRQTPDLILSDVMMPGLDGFGLLKRVRADEATRDIPFILLSARAGEESKIEGLQVGADDYLIKPFGARELLARIGIHLRLARRLREDEEQVARTLAERGEAEQALRESEERFRKTFDHAATGIAIADLEGRFVRCNPAYSAITGYARDELTGLKWHALIHPEDRERNFLYIRLLMGGKLPSFEIESRYVQKTGDAVWVRKYVSLLRDEKGNPAHVIALVNDVTTRRHAEETLRRAHDTLEQQVAERTRELRDSEAALRALSAALLTAQEDERRRIARDLHDDVTQQLALLSLEVGGLAVDVPAANDHAHAGIRSVQNRLVQVTQDVRRMSHGLHSSLIEDLGLAAALQSLCEEYGKKRGLQVTFETSVGDADIHATTASVLYRIAQESMTNAAEQAGARSVRVELRRTDELVELAVADDGAGFDPGQTGGRGALGLVNMRERVRLVNGTLSVTSWPGRGSSIRASVPLERVVVAAAQSAAG